MMTILAAVATFERNRISERTREALARAKEQGVKLGSHTPNVAAANESNRQAAYQWCEQYRALIREYQAQGLNQTKIAVMMNLAGLKTRGGGNWSQPHVSRLVRRLEKKEAAG